MYIAMTAQPATRQQGVALFTAMVFLVIITLISVAAMRSSTMELRMATNEQEHRIGIDSTQSASDAVVELANIKITADGDTTCIGFGKTPTETLYPDNPDTSNNETVCNDTQQLAVVPGAGNSNTVQLTQLRRGTCPPFIATGERASISGSNCAYFTLDSVYDATAQRGGRSATIEGLVLESF
jgi:type IV pilus assembly protein PilX